MQSERSPTRDPGCIASVPLSVSTVTPRRCAPVPPRPSLSVSIYTCLHLSGSYLYLSVSLFIPYTVCLCSHPRQLLSLPLPCVLCLHLCPDERPGHAPPLADTCIWTHKGNSSTHLALVEVTAKERDTDFSLSMGPFSCLVFFFSP